MQAHLLIGSVPCANIGEVDETKWRWICEQQPALNTDGTEHGHVFTELKREFVRSATASTD